MRPLGGRHLGGECTGSAATTRPRQRCARGIARAWRRAWSRRRIALALRYRDRPHVFGQLTTSIVPFMVAGKSVHS